MVASSAASFCAFASIGLFREVTQEGGNRSVVRDTLAKLFFERYSVNYSDVYIVPPTMIYGCYLHGYKDVTKI